MIKLEKPSDMMNKLRKGQMIMNMFNKSKA